MPQIIQIDDIDSTWLQISLSFVMVTNSSDALILVSLQSTHACLPMKEQKVGSLCVEIMFPLEIR